LGQSTLTAIPTALPYTPPAPADTILPTETPTQVPTNVPTPSGQVTLDAVGDIMLGRIVGQQVLAKGPQIVFAGVQSVLAAADIRVGNLECAITDLGTPAKKLYMLQAPPAAAMALSLGKFDLVGVANNHAMDYGYLGLADEHKTLKKDGIATVGAGVNFDQAHTPVLFERNGLHLAFLAYVDVPIEHNGFDTHTWAATADQPGLAWADPVQIKIDVAAARRQADVVVVLLHSGIEIGKYMPTISANQRADAYAAIDGGAALVLGAHPHVLEPIEHYHGGLIAFSLGNFVFDDYQGIANATIILRVVLTRAGLQSFDYVPVLIDNALPNFIPDSQVPAIGTMVSPVNP
jgi:poly-gamma-glutamate synthesis protein (capsule biosynthesis protein)